MEEEEVVEEEWGRVSSWRSKGRRREEEEFRCSMSIYSLTCINLYIIALS